MKSTGNFKLNFFSIFIIGSYFYATPVYANNLESRDFFVETMKKEVTDSKYVNSFVRQLYHIKNKDKVNLISSYMSVALKNEALLKDFYDEGINNGIFSAHAKPNVNSPQIKEFFSTYMSYYSSVLAKRGMRRLPPDKQRMIANYTLDLLYFYKKNGMYKLCKGIGTGDMTNISNAESIAANALAYREFDVKYLRRVLNVMKGALRAELEDSPSFTHLTENEISFVESGVGTYFDSYVRTLPKKDEARYISTMDNMYNSDDSDACDVSITLMEGLLSMKGHLGELSVRYLFDE